MQRRQPTNLRLKMINFNDWKAQNSEGGFKLPNDFACFSTSWSQESQSTPLQYEQNQIQILSKFTVFKLTDMTTALPEYEC